MRHQKAGRKFSRTSSHREAMFKNMASSLFKHELIRTTLPKAKALRPHVEKVITLGKKNTLANVRRAAALLQDKEAVKKLFDVIGPRYANRAGGYTRIMRMGDYRIGDGGSKAVFELVDNNVLERKLSAVSTESAEAPAEATPAKAKRSKKAGAGA